MICFVLNITSIKWLIRTIRADNIYLYIFEDNTFYDVSAWHLGMAWGLVNPKTTEKLLTFEAVEAAEPKILELFFTTNTEPMNNSYIRRMAMSDKGKELMTLYVNITYQEMLNHLPPEEKKGKIEDYETKIKQLIEDSEKTIKEDLIESFYQAYARPLVTGAAGITPPPKSSFK